MSALAIAYLGSPAFLGLADITRKNLRLIVDRIRRDRGKAPVADIQPKHIRADISKLHPHPARARLKAWRSLLKYAVSIGWVEGSVAHKVPLPATPKGGYPQWSPADLAQFRAHWPYGTKQRLAIELAQWTGARRSDVVTFGPANLVDGWLVYTQSKTGGEVRIPFMALTEPCQPFAADHAHLMAALLPCAQTWLETAAGRARSREAVTEWVRVACQSAGLLRRSLHGLRKYRAAMQAEAGWSENQIMAWSGHTSSAEAQGYVRGARAGKLLGG